MSSQTIGGHRQPLLTNQASSGSCQFAEVADGTTAECAAVCCCCPCGLVNLLYLAIYKVPSTLCWRALRRNSRKKLHWPFHNRRTGKSSWPELVGVNGEAAAATIVRENPKVAGTVIVKEGMMVTMDFRSDRVRVWVDKNETVKQTPQIG
ncbi:hypothetical protein FH972_006068 [Carpinus fangiana]|uniref:Uncharacterized protein n=1 Tax=Carpinus fangiana TaxID=176857 RepID=A0A5N6QUP3_9ROSI|nr:hypothetical protein FH972_006068 [Carpinus fangiana]